MSCRQNLTKDTIIRVQARSYHCAQNDPERTSIFGNLIKIVGSDPVMVRCRLHATMSAKPVSLPAE
jgi:hypothetical protein